MPISPTASRSSNSAAAGVRCRCGWRGNFRIREVTAVSNSPSQREFIEGEAGKRGLNNLRVVTAGHECVRPETQFDRIVSVEMFEHMMNWRELMSRVRSWLKPDGRFFMHIFTHRSGAYLFDRADGEDWIAQHFFTGGVMPSHHLIRQYADLFEVEKEWRWSGTHYQRTAQDWLANFDLHRDEIEAHAAPRLWRRHRVVDAALALVLPRDRQACSVTPTAANGASAITG